VPEGDRQQAQLEPRVAGARPPQRLLCHVGCERMRTGTRERGAERALAAAEVEHALARPHVRQQEVLA